MTKKYKFEVGGKVKTIGRNNFVGNIIGYECTIAAIDPAYPQAPYVLTCTDAEFDAPECHFRERDIEPI